MYPISPGGKSASCLISFARPSTRSEDTFNGSTKMTAMFLLDQLHDVVLDLLDDAVNTIGDVFRFEQHMHDIWSDQFLDKMIIGKLITGQKT